MNTLKTHIRLYGLFFILSSLILPAHAQDNRYGLPDKSYNVPRNVATGVRGLISAINNYAAFEKKGTLQDVATKAYERIRADIYDSNPCQRMRLWFIIDKYKGTLNYLIVEDAPFEREGKMTLGYPKPYTAVIKYTKGKESILSSSNELIFNTKHLYVYPEFDCNSAVMAKLVAESTQRNGALLDALARVLNSNTENFEKMKEDIARDYDGEVRIIEGRIERRLSDKKECEKVKERIRGDIKDVDREIENSKDRLSYLKAELDKCNRRLRGSKPLIQDENVRAELTDKINNENRILSRLNQELQRLKASLNGFDCDSHQRDISRDHSQINIVLDEKEDKHEKIDEVVMRYERYSILVEQLKIAEISAYQSYRRSLSDKKLSDRAADLNERYKRRLASLLSDKIVGEILKSGEYIADPIEHYRSLLPITE